MKSKHFESSVRELQDQFLSSHRINIPHYVGVGFWSDRCGDSSHPSHLLTAAEVRKVQDNRDCFFNADWVNFIKNHKVNYKVIYCITREMTKMS